MRLFVAIELDATVRSALERLQLDELSPKLEGARYVPPRNLHLTLRFLGETPLERLAPLSEHLETAAERAAPFDVSFVGVGVFPRNKRARVLWVGVEDPTDALTTLQEHIESAVVKSGFEAATKPFAPHLTIARFKRPRRVPHGVLGSLGERTYGVIRVEDVVLVESHLSDAAPRYEIRKRFRLGSRA